MTISRAADSFYERAVKTMVYFVSDMHFGHVNSIKHSGRTFGSVEKMNEAIVARSNSKVRPKYSLFILDDAV